MFNCLLNGCLTIIIMKSLLHECRLTCVYAACKIEENHVSAEELGKGISQDHQMILNYEMIVYQALFWAHISLSCPFFFFCSWFQTYSVMQALEFDLIVYPPYRPLEGFINDMEVRLVKPFWASSFILCTRKSSSLGFCLFLDLCFLPYPVTAIAIVGNKIRIYRISAK